MKPHYWNDSDKAERDADLMLQICVRQGYVPSGCQLGGHVVLALTTDGKDPCIGCECPREICGGRDKSGEFPDLMEVDWEEQKRPALSARDRTPIKVPD